ncbi:hypothetical protein N0V90_008732 [Kalmusia sp. IMI 367209]|nr:hypothetical protein N0V90_008732 [Kalmusia sp. IMI 367209]
MDANHDITEAGDSRSDADVLVQLVSKRIARLENQLQLRNKVLDETESTYPDLMLAYHCELSEDHFNDSGELRELAEELGGIGPLRRLKNALDKLGGFDAFWVGKLHTLAAMEDVVNKADAIDALEQDLLPLKTVVDEAGVEPLQETIALVKAVRRVLGGTQEETLSQLATLSTLIKDAGSVRKLEEQLRFPVSDAIMKSLRKVTRFLMERKTEK